MNKIWAAIRRLGLEPYLSAYDPVSHDEDGYWVAFNDNAT
jgi:hypothetical protein